MNLNRERIGALVDICRITLTDGEAAALENELNELLTLADRLREDAARPCPPHADRHAS